MVVGEVRDLEAVELSILEEVEEAAVEETTKSATGIEAEKGLWGRYVLKTGRLRYFLELGSEAVDLFLLPRKTFGGLVVVVSMEVVESLVIVSRVGRGFQGPWVFRRLPRVGRK
jgi:hypothetical protein